ncbi:MAG: hypothetical protein ACTSP4_09400 [Candidatus Hodarchaeales archaeon]
MDDKRKEMTDEFKQKYGNMTSRLHMLSITQPEKVESIADTMGEIDLDAIKPRVKFFANLYLFILTEEILLVPPGAFIDDFLQYIRLRGKEITQLEESSIIKDYFTPFTNSLVLSSKITFEMIGYLINRLGIGWKIEMIKSFILNDYFKPLMHQVAELNPGLDVRYVAAIVRLMVEDFMDRRTRILEGKAMSNLTIKQFYESYARSYPVSEGEDIYFDMAWKLVFQPTWDKTMLLVEIEVEKFKEKVAKAKEEMDHHYEAEKKRKATQYTDDYYLSLIQMKLYELFKGKQDVDDQKEKGIINAVDVMIRRYAIDKYGKIGFEKDELVETVVQMLYGAIKDYPIIAGPLLDFPQRAAAMRADSALEFIAEHDEDLRKKFIKRLTGKHKDKLNARIMAEEFVRLLKDSKKMNFTIGLRK